MPVSFDQARSEALSAPASEQLIKNILLSSPT
jgi:hypothetical protein